MKIARRLCCGGRLARMIAILLATGSMLAAGGCVRTDDGTVTVARELDVGRYWQRPASPPQTPPVQSGTEVFPVAPTQGWSAPRRPVWRKARGQPRGQNTPARPLACHNEFEPGQRARVVCR